MDCLGTLATHVGGRSRLELTFKQDNMEVRETARELLSVLPTNPALIDIIYSACQVFGASSSICSSQKGTG